MMKPATTRHAAVVICFAVLSLMPTERVAAEPYLSVRTGLQCSQCHVNRTGGGGRTAFGAIYAQTRLPMTQRIYRNRAITDYLALSGNVRWVAAASVSGDTPRTNFDLTQVNIQAEVRLIPDVLALYIDESLGPRSAEAREAFILIEDLPLDGYIKAGKFILPYGLRLLDDQEFIRKRSGFNFANPDQGVEVGIEPGPLSLFLSVTNGVQGAAENNDSKQVTATAALVLPRFRVGASASRNPGLTAARDVIGGFAGFNLGRLTFLGELDLITDRADTGGEVEQFAAYVEGNLLLAAGLNAKVTYGYLDPNAAIGENARTRLRFGLETFPTQFVQVSAFYTLLEDIPQSTTDVDRLSLELHLFF